MTDLQLGSLAIGGALVVAVYAFNSWQEYRYRKQAAKAFARNQPDVLLETPQNVVRKGDSQRLEPALGVPAAAEVRHEPELATIDEGLIDEEVGAVGAAKEPSWYEPPVEAAPRVPPQRPQVQRTTPAPTPAVQRSSDDTEVASSLLDPALDFVAEIHAGVDIPADEIPPFPGAKRVQVIGQGDDGRWQIVYGNTNAAFNELRVGLQLADRQGPLTQEQLNGFCMAVQQFADGHEAVVTFPQRSAKLAAAADLDEFCASVDVLIGLNVIAHDKPFPLERVRLLAEQARMVRTPDGTFHYKSDSGKTLFVLANQDQSPFGNTSPALTLLFDVPRVAGGLEVFEYLCDFALHLSQSLGGNLVDDNGKPLTESSLGNIHRQLGGIYARMDDRGIVPGSMAALRLFA